MITIVDSSWSVLFNNQKSLNELLKTINATVNHELRNPLNSIVSITELKKKIYEQMNGLLSDNSIDVSNKVTQLKAFISECISENEIQCASTKII